MTFRILYMFLVLKHERRQIVHFNVTAHPTARWTAQQLVEAFPFDTVLLYLLRDRDAIYGERSFGPLSASHSAPKPFWQSLLPRLRGALSALRESRATANAWPPGSNRLCGTDR